ncbi:YjbH domain-containing protein [Parasalinivibrio latis]
MFRLSVLSLAVISSFSSFAKEFSYPELDYSQTDFGGVGLIQMPSARMNKEGDFRLGVTSNNDYIHYTASLQLFPWLEATVRYTQVDELLYSGDDGFSGDTKYTDKSIDAKIRLIEESYWLPQIAVGLRDIGGTGLFDGEYIVASKRNGPFDFTLGVGWGYLGNRGNLHGDKSTVDCGRDTTYGGKGGQIDAGRMFSGCMAIFGGVEYQTPFAPLRLKLEYDGNDYKSDFPVRRGDSNMSQSTSFNFGLIYQLTDWADLRLSYERGNTFTAGLTLGADMGSMVPVWIDSERPAYQQSVPVDHLSEEQWQALNNQLAENAGYQQAEIYYDKQTITVVGEQKKYRDRSEAQERAALLIANSGIDAKTYRIIETKERQPLTEARIDSGKFAKVASNAYPNATPSDATLFSEPVEPLRGRVSDHRKYWSFGLSPVLQQSFGGSEDFYLYAIGVNADASLKLGDHFVASGTLYGNLVDNYDKFKYTVPPDGTNLRRVRTLTRQYYEETLRVSNLQLSYFDRFGNSLYSQVYAGYLETMFGGVGGEVLYRPMGSKWAMGIDASYVKQRDPHTAFGFYKNGQQPAEGNNRAFNVQTGTVTGHFSVYWQNPLDLFEGTLLKVSAGRYLAEDTGVTVDVSKRFDSGVIAGAFATKTNLSAEEFGEGSFTKGFYISIPFDLLTVKPSTSRTTISWLPIQRDGGQMLSRKYSLYDMTDARSPWYTERNTNIQ